MMKEMRVVWSLSANLTSFIFTGYWFSLGRAYDFYQSGGRCNEFDFKIRLRC